MISNNKQTLQFDLENKINQLTIAISRLEEKCKLPVQLDHANVSAITLCSGRALNDGNDNIPLSKVDSNSSVDNIKANE